MQRKRPCKFGPTCNKYTNGIDCGFLHDGSSAPVPTNPHPHPATGGSGGGVGRLPCKFGAKCNRYAAGTCTFLHDAPGGPIVNPGPGPVRDKGPNPRQPNPSPGTPVNPTGFEGQVCRNFHLNRCQNPETCRRPHKFMINDRLTRTYINNMPSLEPSSMETTQVNGQHVIVLKMGSAIRTLLFNPDSAEAIVSPHGYAIEAPAPINYMKVQGLFIMYTLLSAAKTYTLNVVNLLTNQNYTVNNAYQKEVSGMAMLGELNLITVARDGILKVWNLKAETKELELNKEVSEKLRSSIPGNTAQLLFCKVTEALGSKLLWIGTDDARLLVWDLNTLNFSTISTGNYRKVWDIQMQTIPSQPTALTVGLILAWTENQESILLFVNMADLNMEAFEQTTDLANPITKFLFTEQLVFVGTLKGLVTIKNVKGGEKMGAIIFNRRVQSMSYAEKLTSTEIKLRNVLMLEISNPALGHNQQPGDNDYGKLQVFRYS